MAPALSLEELQTLRKLALDALAGIAHYGTLEAEQALIKKTDAWIADLKEIEQNDKAQVRFALDVARSLSTIEPMMVLSTAHIEDFVAQELEAGDEQLIYHKHGEVGWLVFIPSPEDGVDPLDYISGSLERCMRYAREHGCCWLLLDRDATEVEGLQTYEW